MNRWIITALAVSAVTAISAGPGCANTGVGDPCVPDEEYDPTFQGFSLSDVSVESKSYVCLSRLCLVNHFQGRVTCPYGQQSAGVPFTPGATSSAPADPNAAFGCAIPGSVASSTGYPAASQITATNVSVAGYGTCTAGPVKSCQVPPQITGAGAANRTANNAVYCSCHCANVEGNTNDGENYCTCPENYVCQQLVTSISADANQGLTGGYCVLDNPKTEYNPALATNEFCDPTVTLQGQPGYCGTQY